MSLEDITEEDQIVNREQAKFIIDHCMSVWNTGNYGLSLLGIMALSNSYTMALDALEAVISAHFDDGGPITIPEALEKAAKFVGEPPEEDYDTSIDRRLEERRKVLKANRHLVDERIILDGERREMLNIIKELVGTVDKWEIYCKERERAEKFLKEKLKNDQHS